MEHVPNAYRFQPGGVRLFVEQDPAIEHIYRNGAALVAGELRPVGETEFANGVAAVKKGKWGLINRSGAIVVKHKYDSMEAFSGALISDRSRPSSSGLIGWAIMRGCMSLI